MDNFNNENNAQSTENKETTNTYYQDFTADTTYQPNQTGYTAPVEEKTSGLAVAALVFGILAILTGCCTGCLGIVLGIVGIIFAVIDKKNGSNGVAKGGMVCSIIGLIIGILMTILMVVYFAFVYELANTMAEDPNAYLDMIEEQGGLSPEEMEELEEMLEQLEGMY